MKKNEVRLFTYCVLDKEGNNQPCTMRSDCFRNWKERYMDSFKESYLNTGKNILDVQKYYCDPDQTYKRGYDHSFFDHLTTFLNCRENALRDQLNEKFCYTFEQSLGIKVAEANKPDEALFYLYSDQLGFSAPSNLKNHPYDLYLKRCDMSKQSLGKVANWIARTRTIGGSFLWPTPFYGNYNFRRGGGSYIQDRVDLTLKEIDNWYSRQQDDGIGNDDVLHRWEDLSLGIWLNHFKGFDAYVDFFCFDNFVDGKPRKPKMMLGENRGKVLPEEVLHEKSIQDNLSRDVLREMLNGLSDNVVERSKAMLKIINNE